MKKAAAVKVETLNEWAQELDCRADAIEYLLFSPPEEFKPALVEKDTRTNQLVDKQKSDNRFFSSSIDIIEPIKNYFFPISYKTTKEGGMLDKIRKRFFEQLLELLKSRTNLFSKISYQSHWIQTSAGKPGLYWAINAHENRCDVELFFFHKDKDANKIRFRYFESHKKEIEDAFGESLDWVPKEGKQQHIISKSPFGGLRNENRMTEIENDMVERLIRLEKTLNPFIKML